MPRKPRRTTITTSSGPGRPSGRRRTRRKALDLVNQQLKETPDNVQALLLRLRLNRNKGEYGKAMADVNHALKVNKPKKTEIRESTLHWWKAHVYDDMLEPEKACESYGRAYALARKDNKESLQSISFDYACSLSFLEVLTSRRTDWAPSSTETTSATSSLSYTSFIPCRSAV